MAQRTKTRALDLLEQKARLQAQIGFHTRMQAAGDLGEVLGQVRREHEAGTLAVDSAVHLAEEAVLMSRPFYPFGAGRQAIETLATEDAAAATEARRAIDALHREMTIPDGDSDAPLTEAQVDPLRHLVDDIDPALRLAMEAGTRPQVTRCVRAHVIALADHMQRCQYMSGRLVASMVLARAQGVEPTTTPAMIADLEHALAEVVAPLDLDPASPESLRSALNRRTMATRRRALTAPRPDSGLTSAGPAR